MKYNLLRSYFERKFLMTAYRTQYGKEHSHEIEILQHKLTASGHISEVGTIAYGGSHAYGLATQDSDVDLRGFALPTAHDILMMKDFEQVDTMDGVDATIYSFRKVLGLLKACNPNVVELLGLKEEHILVDSDVFKTIRNNPQWFVSRKCAATFGGYATAQLRRIQNAMSRDGDDARRLAEGALRSMNAAIESFPDRYASYDVGNVSLRMDDDEETPVVYADFDVKGMPIHELRGLCGELDDINKNAATLGKNKRKKDGKVSKHASHLIRLLLAGSDMLETGRVQTYWEGEQAELLLKLKQGMWLEIEDEGKRSYAPEFWELLDEAETRFKYAKENTSLPEKPDEESVDDFMRDVHKKIVVAG